MSTDASPDLTQPNPLSVGPLPGRAGELQRQGAGVALIRELGDNYDTYHDHIVEALRALGGRPQRERFDSDHAYLSAFASAQRLVRFEALLRSCRRVSRDRLPMSLTDAGGVPLLDEHDELLRAP
jgi:hypothetical protein